MKKKVSHEVIKDRLISTMRAIAGMEELKVSFTEIIPPYNPAINKAYYNPSTKSVSLPIAQITPQNLAAIRGEADAVALHILHTKPLATKLPPEHQSFVSHMEEVRAQALGTNAMAGVARNLLARWDSQIKQNGYDVKENLPNIPAAEIAALLAYRKLTASHPKSAGLTLKSLGKIMQCKIQAELDRLPDAINNQTDFASISLQISRKLATASQEETTEQQPESTSSGQDETQDNRQQKTVPSKQSTPSPQIEEQLPAETAVTDGDIKQTQGKSARDFASRRPHIPQDSNITLLYSPYSTQFDETVAAEDLADASELKRHRTTIETRLAEMRDITTRLASRLQRKLMSTQIRHWNFNMEEGILDPARLPQIIADPTFPTPYKWEEEGEYKNTVVSLLIDNSGSMRGRPIMMAAICADILARVLERCGVKVEILGFTTRNWKGGESRKLWLENGSPDLPGRLNDLRHIIYKKADSMWRQSRNNLGLMLREGILKENIDGEAILWAHDRLLRRAEMQKILMVISDGAPVDDSTLSANPTNYLDRHLRDVIAAVEARREVELLAIGIGHNVNKHYSRAVTISGINELGDAMVSQLSDLFTETHPHIHPLRAKTR